MYAKDNESNIITNPINIPASGTSMYVNYSWDANNGAVMTGIGELSDTYNIGTPEGLRSYLSIPANYNTESRDITYSVMGKGQIDGGEEFTTSIASNSITFKQAAASYTLKSLKVTKVDDQVISKDNDLKTLTGNSYTVNSSAHEIEITGILENTVGTHFNTVTPKTTTSTSSTVSVSGGIKEGTSGDDDIRDTFKLNVSIPESTNSGSDTSHEFSLGAGNNDLFKNAITNQIFKFLQKKAAVGSIYIGLLYVGDSDGKDNILTYIGTPGTNSLLGIGEDTTGTISWEIEVDGYNIPVKYVYQTVDPATVTFENGSSKETWDVKSLESEIVDWDSDSKEYLRIHNMVLIPGGFNGGAIQYSSLGGSFNMSTKQTLSNGYSICKGTSTSTFDVKFSIKLFTN